MRYELRAGDTNTYYIKGNYNSLDELMNAYRELKEDGLTNSFNYHNYWSYYDNETKQEVEIGGKYDINTKKISRTTWWN